MLLLLALSSARSMRIYTLSEVVMCSYTELETGCSNPYQENKSENKFSTK